MAISNYYNRYDPKKGYKDLLFIAGRGLQSAELNELQAYIREDLGEIASSLVKDGGILSGGSFQYDENTKTVTLGEAKVLHKKVYVATAPAATITLTGTGKETVGIAVKEEIITELEDPTLRDPAVGFENYNQPGALRKKVSARWTVDSQVEDTETFYPIYEFIDGSPITTQVTPPQMTGPIDLIARYDYNSNGSYVVNGMIATYDSTDPDTGEIIISVSEGTAHVEGFEVTFPYARKVRLTPPTDTKTVLAEPHTFTTDGVYQLRHTPIASVDRIIGVKQETVTITHGNYSGAADSLPNSPVVDVLEVKQGDKVYQEGVDYIVSGDSIDWSLSGSEPAPGSTYTVTYRYQDSSITATITEDRKGINISGLAEDTIFYVDYKYYLPRVDRIILTREGELKALKGVASDTPTPPDFSGGLSLAKVKVFYGQEPEITSDYYRAFRMSDIQYLFNKINEIEYNIARLSLIENARSIDPSTTKKNIFVDPFYDDDLRDSGYPNQTAIAANGILLPGVDWQTLELRKGIPIQLPFTEKIEVDQSAGTRSRRVNRLTWTEAPPGVMTVSPRVYRWVDRTVSRLIAERSALAISMGSDWWNWEGRTIDRTVGGSVRELLNQTEVPQITVSIQAQKFNANEQVDIYFDGKFIKTETADANGIVNASFQVPSGTKSGNKQVLAVGKNSGVRAESVISFVPLVRIIEVVRTRLYNEPIAQTFTLQNDAVPNSIELFFAKKPSDSNFVDVFICETKVGLPDRNAVLTKARLYGNEIVENGWTKFTFDAPVRLTGGREYAIVVETQDTEAEVKVARLGDWDPVNKIWLTAQAYDIGVLLESANSSTWTPIQEEDLTFKLYVRQFETQTELELGTVSVNNATDIVLNCATDNPAGCSTVFKAVLPDGNEVVVNPYQPIISSPLTGEITFKAVLSTENSNLSPTVEGDITVSIGQVKAVSEYVSRFFEISGTELDVYLECYEPSGLQVKVYYDSDGNGTWTELTRGTSGTPTGDGFVEYKFTATGLSLSKTRLKIELPADGSNRTACRNLRAVVV